MILAPQQAIYDLIKPLSEGSEAVLSAVFRDIKDTDAGHPYAIIHHDSTSSTNATSASTRFDVDFSVVVSTEKSGRQALNQQDSSDAHYTAVSHVLDVLNDERRKAEPLDNTVDWILPITATSSTTTQEVSMIQTTFTLTCVIIKKEGN